MITPPALCAETACSCCSSHRRLEGKFDMVSIYVTKHQLLCVQSAHLAVMTGVLASMLPAQLSLQLRFASLNFFDAPCISRGTAGLFAVTCTVS